MGNISYKKYYKTKGILYTFSGIFMSVFYFVAKAIEGIEGPMKSTDLSSIVLFSMLFLALVLIITVHLKLKKLDINSDKKDELYELTLAKTNKTFIKLLCQLVIASIFASCFFETYKISSFLFSSILITMCGIYNFIAYHYEKETSAEGDEI